VVLTLQRQVHDRLSMSEYLVGVQYYRLRYYPGAILRLQGILTSDPQFTGRDGVYYYLGESYYRAGRKTEALPYYDKLAQEFKVSKYLKDTNSRLAELKH
jgi:outer membrane protein assembly factor BamD (BamD/ComL family)